MASGVGVGACFAFSARVQILVVPRHARAGPSPVEAQPDLARGWQQPDAHEPARRPAYAAIARGDARDVLIPYFGAQTQHASHGSHPSRAESRVLSRHRHLSPPPRVRIVPPSRRSASTLANTPIRNSRRLARACRHTGAAKPTARSAPRYDARNAHAINRRSCGGWRVPNEPSTIWGDHAAIFRAAATCRAQTAEYCAKGSPPSWIRRLFWSC